MNHAEQRVRERLTLAGWSREAQEKLYSFSERWAPRTNSDSEAVRLAVLPHIVGEKYGVESNGNEVWAVYRNQRLITVMLRRTGQPDQNLRVRIVNRLV